jgi:hypothetical protein
MNGLTYSWYVTSTDFLGFKWLYTCEPPILASASGATYLVFDTVQQPETIPYRAVGAGSSCSLYTFAVTQNNTVLRIYSCNELFPPADSYPFTHSIIFNSGDVGFVCSMTTPVLVSGSYSNFSITPQPASPCDCGRNYRTTTTTTTSTTTISLTQSWLSRRDCCPSNNPPFTYSNFSVVDFPTTGIPLPGKTWIQDLGATKFCWRLVNPLPIPLPSPPIRKHTETLYNNCADCLTLVTACPSTTTTSTTTIFIQPPSGSTCECGNFQCVNYVIDGQSGDSVKWRECTVAVNSSGIPAYFNFYYFYDTETISICSCSNDFDVVTGNPQVNGSSWPNTNPIEVCSKRIGDGNCTKCRGTFVEIGEALRNSTDRPILVEYLSCYEPDGGHTAPTRTMWPLSAGGFAFNGLPVPLPAWANNLQAMNGLPVYGRKTHLYQICLCGNTKLVEEEGYFAPTISYWYETSWVPSPRSLTQSQPYLANDEHYIWGACNYGTCSCYSYGSCPTTTTTLAPCANCRPTVIGATGPGYTNIIYEGCDTLVKHNIQTDFLFTGNTSSICACERCKRWKVRPITGADSMPYVHCCDSVFSAAGYSVPSWHSSELFNFFPETCRTFSLNSSTSTTFKYIECDGSSIKYLEVVNGDPITSPCVATISYHSGDPAGSITSPTLCGTASVDICVSKHFYGDLSPDHANFGLISPGSYTFSDIGSCSCITSDNRYKTNTYFNFPFGGPELEYLTVTFSNTATCSDKIIIPNTPPTPQVPPCCDCKTYYVYDYSVGDIITYKPCDTNRINTSQVSLNLPKIDMVGTTSGAGSFSVVVRATGLWGVGAVTAIFNNNNLTYYQHTINSIFSGAAFNVSGSYSRFSWSSTTAINPGSIDIITITFAAGSSARLAWVDNQNDNTEIVDIAGNDLNAQLNDGWIKFPGINLPAQESFTGSGGNMNTGSSGINNYANIISGNLLYQNTNSTPMNDTLVEIWGTYGVSNRYTGFSFSGNTIPGGAVLMATSSTNTLGQFSFSVATGFNLSASYSLRLVTTKPWGGVNSTDALLVQRHFSAIRLLDTRLKIRASDTNNSGTINATDALQIANRITAVSSSFTSGNFASDIIDGNDGVAPSSLPVSVNWFIPNNLVGTSSQGWSMSVRVLCIADVNGSYIPPA